MKQNIRKEIKDIIIKNFKLSKNNKTILKSDNIDQWDSMGHLTLLSLIEKKFKISFLQKEIVKMLDEKKIFTEVLIKIKKK